MAVACGGAADGGAQGAESNQTEADDLFTLSKVAELRIELDAAAVSALTSAPRTAVAGKTTRDGRSFAVDVKLKGSASFRPLADKPSFKIHLTGSEKITGLTHFTLNNMVQDTSMVHEVMGYRYYAALGLKAPRAGYAKVFVNGEYKGVYSNIESFEKPLIERTFGSAKGTLFEGTVGADFETDLLDKFDLKFGNEADRVKLSKIADALAAPLGSPAPNADTTTQPRTVPADGDLFGGALIDMPNSWP